MSDAHSVVALDVLGHGGSVPLSPEARLPDFVAWQCAVLDTLFCERVNLAGYSMGTLIAGGFAVTHGNRLEGVAVLNGVFNRDTAAREAVVERSLSDGAVSM